MKGTTSTGFEFEIIPEALDDWETLELLEDVQTDNYLAITRLVKRLLGEEQAKRLKEHCRVDGIVKASRMNDEIMEILSSSAEAKKA